MNDVREQPKVRTLPDDLKKLADSMLQDKFGLASNGDIVKEAPEGSKKIDPNEEWARAVEDVYNGQPEPPMHTYGYTQDMQSKYGKFLIDCFVSKHPSFRDSLHLEGNFIRIKMMEEGKYDPQIFYRVVPIRDLEGLTVTTAIHRLEGDIDRMRQDFHCLLRPFTYTNNFASIQF